MSPFSLTPSREEEGMRVDHQAAGVTSEAIRSPRFASYAVRTLSQNRAPTPK
jgi:hypothetical protein